jgi:hypothetical protein
MPRSEWTDTQERKYEHISAKQRGAPTRRVKEIAARTVNKERRDRARRSPPPAHR